MKSSTRVGETRMYNGGLEMALWNREALWAKRGNVGTDYLIPNLSMR
jgi:hypothetical protein